jgi:hypothetical protein
VRTLTALMVTGRTFVLGRKYQCGGSNQSIKECIGMFDSGERVTSNSSGKTGSVIDRDDDDHVYVKFDDRTYGDLRPDQLTKADQPQP